MSGSCDRPSKDLQMKVLGISRWMLLKWEKTELFVVVVRDINKDAVHPSFIIRGGRLQHLE